MVWLHVAQAGLMMSWSMAFVLPFFTPEGGRPMQLVTSERVLTTVYTMKTTNAAVAFIPLCRRSAGMRGSVMVALSHVSAATLLVLDGRDSPLRAKSDA